MKIFMLLKYSVSELSTNEIRLRVKFRLRVPDEQHLLDQTVRLCATLLKYYKLVL